MVQSYYARANLSDEINARVIPETLFLQKMFLLTGAAMKLMNRLCPPGELSCAQGALDQAQSCWFAVMKFAMDRQRNMKQQTQTDLS